MLTLDDAQRLVRAALDGSGAPEAIVVPALTIERPFGWAFIAVSSPTEHSGVNPAEARVIIVNKYSREILGASMAFFVQNCIDTYEGVLKTKGRDWCLTLAGAWRRPTGDRASTAHRRMLEKIGLTVLSRVKSHDT